LAPDGGQWSALCPTILHQGKKPLLSHWIRGWVGPTFHKQNQIHHVHGTLLTFTIFSLSGFISYDILIQQSLKYQNNFP
jgi:hypothetical protein